MPKTILIDGQPMGWINKSIKNLDADTLITPYNSTVTIKHCEMYQQEDVITIVCGVEVSSAITSGNLVSINSDYRPPVHDGVCYAVGPCSARVTSINVGVNHPADVWVVSGNVFVMCETACKAFIFRLQYRKA